MRGLPEEQPVLSQNTEGGACESEEGQSLAGKKEKDTRGGDLSFFYMKETIRAGNVYKG